MNHATGRGRRYAVGEAIDGIPDLEVLEVSDGRVRCKYEDRYFLDLISP